MGIFSTIANDCAAFMTTIAFGILQGVGEFDSKEAFTTMFVF